MITTRDETKKEYIECECGTHLLQITHDVEYFDDSERNTTQVRQEFWLAMFTYGKYNKKPSFWERLKIIFNYLKTAKMYEDQVILSAEEAKKLSTFINKNIIKTEK